MKFENTQVFNFEGALRGMRNPKESWEKSDSKWVQTDKFDEDGYRIFEYKLGENDLKLAQTLIKAGSEHRKFLRQIFVSVDITAPQYFWAEMDTYKVGTVRNSTSMQHKGVSHRYTIDDFEVDEDIKEVLRIKEKQYAPLIYPYETDEYRYYICENGRKYKVFKNGRVFACEYDVTDNTGRTRHFEEKECFPSVRGGGYFELNIGGKNGEKWLLHRLVATVWLENKNNYATVDHLDMNKGNNSVENLEWVSLNENVKREWDNFDGFDLQKAYKNWKASSKVLPPDRLKIIELYKNGKTQKELAELFDVSQSQISVIVREPDDNTENKELFEHCWYWEQILETLNILRDKYLDTKDYKYFRMIRQLMPMGYLYRSTVTMNYENLLNMCSKGQRRFHKLTEWSKSFIDWARTLPYAQELIFIDEQENK
ncbi:MAG: helix-turn-helix domain-containing protein [Paludibacteraceae bacterium]|nr:helix-turn-helix domain-containing protein [Paludibacteraceae bacterium]